MIPFLAFGAAAAAAFFLSGCKEEVPLPPPEPKDAGPEASPPPPPPPPTKPKGAGQDAGRSFAKIEETLKGHPLALEAYGHLKASGVSLAELDHGCHVRDKIDGAGDDKVEACEVYEHALDHYKKYPMAARAAAGGSLPWVLTDNLMRTQFDNDIRNKVDQAIDQLKNNPELKGLDPNSENYQRTLAYALFYFLIFPDKPPATRSDKGRWAEWTRPLRALGLHDFQDFLFKEGGLGTEGFKSGAPRLKVDGALEALKKKEGADISKANILYAVFARAGLNPFFAEVPLRYSHAKRDFTAVDSKNDRIYKSVYLMVGLPLGSKPLLFHPELVLEMSQMLKEYSIIPSLRHHLSHYLTSHAENIEEYEGKIDEANHLLRQSIELWPQNGDAYNGLALNLVRMKREEEAKQIFEKGLQPDHDPKNWFLNFNYGSFLLERGRAEASLRFFLSALESQPDYFTEGYLKEDLLKAAEKVLSSSPSSVRTRIRARRIQKLSNSLLDDLRTRNKE